MSLLRFVLPLSAAFFLFLCLCLLLAIMGGARIPAQQLLYSAAQAGGQRDLVLLDLRTGLAPRLTQDGAGNQSPQLSPDAQTIIYQSDRRIDGLSYRYFAISPNGREMRPLLPDQPDLLRQTGTPGLIFAWSPDGRYLANTALQPAQGARQAVFFIIDLQNGQIFRQEMAAIPLLVRWNQPLTWMPDSRRLRWVFVEGQQFSVYEAHFNGTAEILMQGQFGFDELRDFPRMAPSGDYFLVHGRTEAGELWVRYDLDGQMSLIEAVPEASLDTYVWSRDGQQLAFSSAIAGGGSVIGLSSPDGGPARILLSTRRKQLTVLSWSPDDRWILYHESNAQADAYCLLDSSDATTQCLISGGAAPVWR